MRPSGRVKEMTFVVERALWTNGCRMVGAHLIDQWTKGWEFDDKIGISKTKLRPFTELFGETDDAMHESIKIRNKTDIPNKNGMVHTVSFWKDLFLEACDAKTSFNLTDEDKKQRNK